METSTRRSLIPMSPSHTPRSYDKIPRDNRSADGNGNGKHDKEKGVNIQVVLRCRPITEEEKRLITPSVVSCNESRREVSVTHKNVINKHVDRTFTFDKVFGPKSKQEDVFEHAVVPLVNEVLEGYNCTIFAYGQTGTGKTYTMEGGGTKMQNGELPSDAGVISRAVRRIFEILENQGTEYNMKVSFLELYNEEITDLLAPEEIKFIDEKTKKPIALMEDGKGGVLVRGLEEETVGSAGEIYKILEKGSSKRKTAETLLNKQSSRSHSIFSITIHIKECTPEGEELIKCGKLNLVDLAGSENVSRSGAKEGRAREAGEINKSLLTLGRVINTLVEHSGHIPYRDSKLTRLLRDSLGGKTKTCIIATISPAIHCLDETISTLDYAHRAKNIRNRPEVNQKMMKTALIKDLYTDIDRLKQELYAAREKNGVYIPKEQYVQDEAEKKAMLEKLERMEMDIESKDKQLLEIKELYDNEKMLSEDLTDKLHKSQNTLEQTENALADMEQRFTQATSTIKEKEFLISHLLKSEKDLFDQASKLRLQLEDALSDVSGLFSKIERKNKLEDSNKTLVQNFQSQLTQELGVLQNTVSASVAQQETQLKELCVELGSFFSTKAQIAEQLKDRVKKMKEINCSSVRELDDLVGEINTKSELTFENLNSQVKSHTSTLENCFNGILVEADELLSALHKDLSKQEEALNSFIEQQHQRTLSTIEATRSISKVTEDFFDTLDTQTSKFCTILEDSRAVNNEQFSQFQKKFEDCAAEEEKYLLEKVAELMADSNSRKKKMVEEAIGNLRETATKKTIDLQTEMEKTRNASSSIREKWGVYVETTENSYSSNTSALGDGKCCLEEVIQQCMQKVKLSSETWRNAQSSLSNIAQNHIASSNTIIRDGAEANQILRAKVSTLSKATIEDSTLANKDLGLSIDDSLRIDQELHEKSNAMIAPCHEKLRELQSMHHSKVLDVSDCAETSLKNDYLVDEPTCSTPRKRSIKVPSPKSIEELKSPAFDELIKAFWEDKVLAKHSGSDLKISACAIESPNSRQPFSAIN
ncbi:kinesin-related protein-like protein [Carex littledalei]|uniref:Kinesin-related protein-like protein n=1 Tax=Carex littledalei TaxID=544730 RepID=A0A833V9K9_9POAL|nr:kinesin-related protein-like protein [Carex littledalei]